MAKKTLSDLVELAKHDATVHAAMTLHQRDPLDIPLQDALIMTIFALVEQRDRYKKMVLDEMAHRTTSTVILDGGHIDDE